jgi:hypothetical protein
LEPGTVADIEEVLSEHHSFWLFLFGGNLSQTFAKRAMLAESIKNEQ